MEIIISVGSEGHNVVGLLVTNPETQVTISKQFGILVGGFVVNRESEGSVPEVLIFWGHPLEPPAD